MINMKREINVTNETLNIFFSLLKDSIYRLNSSDVSDLDVNWEQIYQLAYRNSLDSIMFQSINQCCKDKVPDTQLKQWKTQMIEKTLHESKKYFAIKDILAEAQKEGIKMVFFKGCILAHLYPQCLHRYSSDTDIFVYERDREKAILIIERLGYNKNEDHSKENVLVYVNNENLHVIELHFCLWEDYTGRKMKLLNDMDLTNEETLITVKVCNISFVTMGLEEHLVYQMFHIIKHFSLQSVGLRYLVDITLYINQYNDRIDIESFWNNMKKLGYATFCYAFFEICIEMLGMNRNIIEKVSAVKKTDPNSLLKDMINPVGGVGDNKMAWQMVGLIKPYLEGEETVSDSKLMRLLRILFQSRKALPDKCNYAKQYPVLLPIAWLHKIFGWILRYIEHYLGRKSRLEGDLYGAGEKLATAEYRLSLMKDLGLTDKIGRA